LFSATSLYSRAASSLPFVASGACASLPRTEVKGREPEVAYRHALRAYRLS
jgi:hypothetical protein